LYRKKIDSEELDKKQKLANFKSSKLAAIGCALACYLIGGLEHVDEEVIGYHI